MRTISVLPYDNNWAIAFEKIRQELHLALSDSALSIEHVGSTSVPCLYKPIIDIDIVIERAVFDVIKKRLSEIGYQHVGDLGIEGREAFKYEKQSTEPTK